jgi:HAD superfamily hydrolase (TIGR01459 family)
MRSRRISGLGEIANEYDAFLLDQYGVIHDGRHLYGDVADVIVRLAAAGKAIVVMTNSGKRSEANRRRLAAMGLVLEPSQVVSSGEVAYQDIKTGRLGWPFTRGRKAFIVGKRGDDYGFEGLDLEFVSKPRDAEFLLILGTNVPEWNVDFYRELLNGLAGQAIPALCCNPDLEMLTPSGVHPAPGAIARIYEELGGKVVYIGKPERAIYAYAIAAVGSPRSSRTLALGDSISHDVVGARGAGIAVALVLTGLSHGMTDAEIADRADRLKAEPDWVLPSLRW